MRWDDQGQLTGTLLDLGGPGQQLQDLATNQRALLQAAAAGVPGAREELARRRQTAQDLVVKTFGQQQYAEPMFPGSYGGDGPGGPRTLDRDFFARESGMSGDLLDALVARIVANDREYRQALRHVGTELAYGQRPNVTCAKRWSSGSQRNTRRRSVQSWPTR
jgi:hypothetical protein